MIDSPLEEEPLANADVILAGFLSFVVVAACFWASFHVDNRIIEGSRLTHNLFDVWFEGDCPRAFDHMTMRVAGEDRTLIHPLFSLAGSLADIPPVMGCAAPAASSPGAWSLLPASSAPGSSSPSCCGW